MDDNIEQSTTNVNYVTHHIGKDLDVDSYNYTEILNLTSNFLGDNADYAMLLSKLTSMYE